MPLDVFLRLCPACSTQTIPIEGSGCPKKLYKLEFNLQKTLPEFWISMNLGLQTAHLPSCAMVGVNEMAIRPGIKIIKLVDSSFQIQLHYGCSFDLVLKELGTTFCPLSRF